MSGQDGKGGLNNTAWPYIGLSAKDKEIQACTLLYCLGTDADDILMTTRITDEDRKSM